MHATVEAEEHNVLLLTAVIKLMRVCGTQLLCCQSARCFHAIEKGHKLSPPYATLHLAVNWQFAANASNS
jgi:hypothetical protein